MTRERVIQLGGDAAGELTSELANCLVPAPADMWRAWVRQIVADPEMNRDRILRHIQAHVGEHMPNADAPPKRWEEWLAGTYNLMAILAVNIGIDPPHAVGIDLLMRKYLSAPTDHTPPPARVKRNAAPTHYDDSGS